MTIEEVNAIFDWLNSFEQLKGTAVPLRFKEHMIQLPTEPSEWFPLGAELTSLENGKLIVAPEGTPREEIVGVVTLDGLQTI